MQVLCGKANGNAEIHCCVCGQGFVLFWDRQSATERTATRSEIQETLRRQHRRCAGSDAHPHSTFLVPQWETACLSAALPGNVPVWDL